MSYGTLDLDTLEINAGGSFAMSDGELTAGIVVGDLEISGGQLLLTSTVIGSLTMSAGSMEVFGATQVDGGDFSLQQDATLAIALFTGGNDRISVTGDVSLAGSLDVQLLEGIELEPGQEFSIIDSTGGSVNGQFAGLADGDVVGNFGGTDLYIRYGDNNDGGTTVVTLYTEDVILGDVNGDGVINLLDVEPFIEVISSGSYHTAADINQDGTVDLLDIDPFIQLLSD